MASTTTKNTFPNLLANKSNFRNYKSMRQWFESSHDVMDPKWLEATHDYVQQILPTATMSKYNTNAYTMPIDDLGYFVRQGTFESTADYNAARINVLCAAAIMLRFFGLVLNVDDERTPVYRHTTVIQPMLSWGKIVTVETWSPQDPRVVNFAENSHNALRVTRLVESLRLFGFCNIASAVALSLNSLFEFVGRFSRITSCGDIVFKQPIANQFLAREMVILNDIHNYFNSKYDDGLSTLDLSSVRNTVLRVYNMDGPE